MRTRLVLVVAAAVLITLAAGSSEAQEWVEVASPEERFFAVFPAQPQVTETTWMSQFGAVLPARVYSVTRGQSRYSA
jgi:hypothetical protein